MYFVGDVSVKAKKLSEVTYKSMMKAINILSKNITLGDIGFTIQDYRRKRRFFSSKRFLWTWNRSNVS
jgi:Methionine aminopeptidase